MKTHKHCQKKKEEDAYLQMHLPTVSMLGRVWANQNIVKCEIKDQTKLQLYLLFLLCLKFLTYIVGHLLLLAKK